MFSIGIYLYLWTTTGVLPAAFVPLLQHKQKLQDQQRKSMLFDSDVFSDQQE
jgi:hypothetical protein